MQLVLFTIGCTGSETLVVADEATAKSLLRAGVSSRYNTAVLYGKGGTARMWIRTVGSRRWLKFTLDNDSLYTKCGCSCKGECQD